MKSHVFLTALVCIFIVGAACPASAQEQQITPSANPAPSISIDEAVMCTGVVDRVPQGVPQTAAPAEGQAAAPAAEFPAGTVCCFCRLSGTAPATIKHAWYFGEKLITTIDLAVDGSPWRTWSNKTIPPEMIGKWKVEIQDAGGTVLKTLEFEVK